jgi:hypothetical protein
MVIGSEGRKPLNCHGRFGQELERKFAVDDFFQSNIGI